MTIKKLQAGVCERRTVAGGLALKIEPPEKTGINVHCTFGVAIFPIPEPHVTNAFI
jgi:hypothetical protein